MTAAECTRNPWRFGAAVAVLVTAGCARPPAESPTRGRLVAAVAESHAALLGREAALFDDLYTEAHVSLRATSTREAFVALVADSARMVVVDRPANDGEQRVLAELGREIESVPIAEDALAIVVHRDNGLASLSLPQLAELLSGRTSTWDAIPEAELEGPVEVVTTGRNSGSWELLATRFFSGAGVPVPARVLPTQQAVLAAVAASPRALGVVSVAAWREPGSGPAATTTVAGQPGWANGISAPPFDDAVHVLAIAGVDERGSPVVHALHQANIHNGAYPLHYSIYVLFDKRSLLAAGFCAFLASAPGQKRILDAGLVPATMPVRLVQLK